jgi:hypothetical protein
MFPLPLQEVTNLEPDNPKEREYLKSMVGRLQACWI